jgi:hypothetical protein
MSKVRWRHGDTLPAPEAATDLPRKAPTDLRARLEQLPAGHPSSPYHDREGSSGDSWRQALAAFAAEWTHYQDRWAHRDKRTERRALDVAVERQLEVGCERILAAEGSITGSLRDIEAANPARSLSGLEFRLKGRDRIIEKANQNIANKPDRTPEAALALIPDAVRYTFCYSTADYTIGVGDDVRRLKAAGFEMLKLKNLWSDPEYKGINSQWRDTRTGQRFEVQFHTAFSFEAKQVTHGAYEHLRQGDITDDEESALEAFQRKVTATVPLPQGALDIPEQS